MTAINVILQPEAVNARIEAAGLSEGPTVPIETVLLQRHHDDPTGKGSVMFIVEVDGKRVVAKTTLRLMEIAVRSMRAAAGPCPSYPQDKVASVGKTVLARGRVVEVLKEPSNGLVYVDFGDLTSLVPVSAVVLE